MALVALREFFGLATACGYRAFQPAGFAAAGVWLLVPNLDGGFLATLLALSLAGAATLARIPPKRLFAGVAITVFGVLYVAGPLLAGLRLHAVSPHWLVFALASVGIGDTVALAVGRPFGRHPLSATVSPRKTWEGTIASAVAATAAGTWYLASFLLGEVSFAAIALAFAVNVASQVGDLSESALKRAAGIKDSGAILPGHGGLLDRMDGALFALPVVYAYMSLS